MIRIRMQHKPQRKKIWRVHLEMLLAFIFLYKYAIAVHV